MIVNTGDDYEYLGLQFAPDLDTVLYALAGIASVGAGWEPEGETRKVQNMLKALGGHDRHIIGDRSLAAPIPRRVAAQPMPPDADHARVLPTARIQGASCLSDVRCVPMC